jgi:hypothetical protein
MKWLDVAGPPGVGKSTLCDAIWGPHEVAIADLKPPEPWHHFTNEVTRLFHLIRPHPTYDAAIRMNNRSFRKMASVAAAPETKGPYIQTGLAQRGLGFGWRLVDLGIPVEELTWFFRLMPVSIGVALLQAPPGMIEQRNHARRQVAATAHEDRAHMVQLMLPAIRLALEVLNERGIPVTIIDTTQDVDDTRRQLLWFANQKAADAPAPGPGGQGGLFRPPPWWLEARSRGALPLAYRAKKRAAV